MCHVLMNVITKSPPKRKIHIVLAYMQQLFLKTQLLQKFPYIFLTTFSAFMVEMQHHGPASSLDDLCNCSH